MNVEEFYQDVILDHCRHPRNFGTLSTANVHAEGDNPSCGDEVALHLDLRDDLIHSATFTGSCCSICMASASLMTIKLQHCPTVDAWKLLTLFQKMLTEGTEPPPLLGDLRILQGVKNYPQRVKCATLPWQTLKRALLDNMESLKTLAKDNSFPRIE